MMGKHKDKWYEPYKVVTVLDKPEVIRRIESKIALKFVWSPENYLFYGKKEDDGVYRVFISSLEMPPRGHSNPFFFFVTVKIIENTEEKCIVFFWLKPVTFIWTDLFLYVVCTILFAVEGINVLVYVFIHCLMLFMCMEYWKFVRRRVGEWVEELLDVKKEIEE